MIAKSKDLRENSDYDAYFEPSVEEAEWVINNAEKFLEKMKKTLMKEG